MKVSKILASTAVATMLVGTSVAAQAAPAELSRMGATIEGERQSGGFPFLIVFVVIAAGLGLYFAVSDSDDEPTSP